MSTSSCCHENHGSDTKKSPPDLILWGSIAIIIPSVLWHLYGSSLMEAPGWLTEFTDAAAELLGRMWWGVALGIAFAGLVGAIPRDVVMATLGRGNSFRGILRATAAGVMLDLCSHGILLVGMRLYERGASLGQVMAFLIASPWNSLSLTLILWALIGGFWTLTFIVLSVLIAITAGLLCDRLVSNGTLPTNPNTPEEHGDEGIRAAWHSLRQAFNPSLAGVGSILWDGLKQSRMILRWLFLGVVLAGLIRTFIPTDAFQTWFGPSLAGLALTLVAATIIEVCSEGSTPIAADLLTRAHAPGNAFTFLMAGVSTDYTEIMAIKETTKSWKAALFLPVLTLPQILVLGWILNVFGATQ